MHEYSIVRALLEQCEQLACEHGAESITKVVVKIGQLSGVEADLLASAFEGFKLSSLLCQRAELELHWQAVVIQCHGCARQSQLQALDYHCPRCQSNEVTLVDGDGLFLMRLEMA